MHRSLTAPATRLAAATVALLLGATSGAVQAQEAQDGKGQRRPIILEQQGSFAFGGTVLTDAATDSTLHCDHGYAEFQIPDNARELPLIMWHSTSTKTWTSTPGGPDGFQDIFLRRGFAVYIIDLPRQGRAGLGCVTTTYAPDVDFRGRDQRTFIGWRLGTWDLPGPPMFFPNSQAPKDTSFLNQVLRARYPDNEDFEDTDSVEASAVAALLEKSGPATLFTHSGSGRYGWLTAIRSPKVRGIVSFEPGVYTFPEGEVPPLDDPTDALPVPLADFQKLTRIPILLVLADFLDDEAGIIRLASARAFVEAVNRHGGDAQLIHLPEIGIVGNSHILMLERNNVQIANLLQRYLHSKGLDRRVHDSASAAVASDQQ